MHKRRIAWLVVLALMTQALFVTVPSFASEAVALAPYAMTDNVKEVNQLQITGYTCSNGFECEMHYNYGKQLSVICFNVDGKYSSVSFKAGYVRGTSSSVEFTVLTDGRAYVDHQKLAPTSVAKSYTVPLSGVKQLMLRFDSGSYDSLTYGIGDVFFTPGGDISEEKVRVSDEFYDIPRFNIINAELLDRFSMGGYRYKGGYQLATGYTGNGTSSLHFNFQNTYRKMSFDVGALLDDRTRDVLSPSELTIQVDGATLPGYDKRTLRWSDLVLPVELDLNGVTEVIITITCGSYDRTYWAVGNIQLVSDGLAHGVKLESNAVTLTAAQPNFALNPKVYPSDAGDKTWKIVSKSSTPEVAVTIDDDNGCLYGRYKGTAEYAFAPTTNENAKTICNVTSNLADPKFLPTVDGWGFDNTKPAREAGGVDYDLLDAYQRLSGIVVDLPILAFPFAVRLCNSSRRFGYNLFRSLENQDDALCYGMSMAAALTYHGKIPFSTWTWAGNAPQKPFDIKSYADARAARSKSLNLSLIGLIYACQLSQFTLESRMNELIGGKDRFDLLLDAVRNYLATGEKPVVIGLLREGGAHAVFPYQLVEKDHEIDIYIYDPNVPFPGENNTRHPDQRRLVFSLDEKGDVASWRFEGAEIAGGRNYTSFTFLTNTFKIGERIKQSAPFSFAKEILFTTYDSFTVNGSSGKSQRKSGNARSKKGNTLLRFENNRFTVVDPQTTVLPLTDSKNEDLGGVAVALYEDQAVTLNASGSGTTAYYGENCAIVVDAKGGASITKMAGEDSLQIVPSADGKVTVRVNVEDSSIIAEGTVPGVLRVTARDDGSMDVTGFSDIQVTTVDGDTETPQTPLVTDPGTEYTIADDGTVTAGAAQIYLTDPASGETVTQVELALKQQRELTINAGKGVTLTAENLKAESADTAIATAQVSQRANGSFALTIGAVAAGETTVTTSYTDADGKKSYASLRVVVEETVLKILDASGQKIEKLLLAEKEKQVLTVTAGSAKLTRENLVAQIDDAKIADCALTYGETVLLELTANALGVTKVVLTYTDDAGQKSSKTLPVTVTNEKLLITGSDGKPVSELTVAVDESTQLTISAGVAQLTDANLSIECADKSVANASGTYQEDGSCILAVSGVAEGETTVTATYVPEKGEKQAAALKVRVVKETPPQDDPDAPQRWSVPVRAIALNAQTRVQLKLKQPQNDRRYDLSKYVVDDPSIAELSVNKKGQLFAKGLKLGQTKMYRIYDDGTRSELLELRVRHKNELVKKVKAAKKITLNMKNHPSAWIDASITPTGALDKELFYFSLSPDVATVSQEGEVKAISPGTTTITVFSTSMKKATGKVTVDGLTKKIKILDSAGKPIKKLSLSVGDTICVHAPDSASEFDEHCTVNLYGWVDEDASNPQIEWSSSNRNVVRKLKDGVFEVVGAGKGKIVLEALDGSKKSSSVSITVK